MNWFLPISLSFYLLLLSCQKESIRELSPTFNRSEFSIILDPMENVLTTRSNGSSNEILDSLYYYFTPKDLSQFYDFPQKEILTEQKIYADEIPTGESYLLVLGSAKLNKYSQYQKLSVCEPQVVSDYLVFYPENHPGRLDYAYFYRKHLFTISGHEHTDLTVKMQRIIGKVVVNIITDNDYLNKTLTSIKLKVDTALIYKGISVDGRFQGEHHLKEMDLYPNNSFYCLPTIENHPIIGEFILTSRNHSGEEHTSSYKCKFHIYPNRQTEINIIPNHITSDCGTTIVSYQDFKEESQQILADNEPKSIFYNNDLRSFHVNCPLKLSSQNNKLTIMSYSPIGLNNVMIYAKDPSGGDFFEFMKCDTIFPFSSISVSPTLLRTDGVVKTINGQIITKKQISQENLSKLQYKIVCENLYWKKIEAIRAKWWIRFSAYGGDPDTWNGSPNGNWMGIRPVHIREAIAHLTNIAYLCTLPEFDLAMKELQGQVWGNGGKQDLIDMETVIPAFENHSGFNVGLVYTGHGVVGLGGGSTWGVAQGVFFNSYYDHGSANVLFHELGHCIGYGHSSGMTYGPFAEKAARIYINNISQLPIPSQNILSSNTNPYKY